MKMIQGFRALAAAVSVAAILALPGVAMADNHTPNFCSTINKNVCAHLGHFDKFESSKEMEFMAHLMTPQDQEVQNFKLDIWMDMGHGHGHGSSPVTITPQGINKFWISHANFVMEGHWLVRLDFTLGGVSHHIDIPVEVAP